MSDAPLPLPRWEYDEHRFPDAPRSGGVFPVPAAAWDAAPVYSIRFGGVWLGAVIGILSALDQYDAWQGTDEQIYDARQAVREIIASLALATGNSLMLRQNSTNPCLLEQSLDGGDTWELAFDYSLCSPALLDDILEIVNATRGTQIEDFTILEININAPISTWGATASDDAAVNEERAQALCALAHWIATGSAETLAQVQEGNITGSNIAAAALAIGTGIIGLVFPPALIVGALKWATLGAILSAGGLALFSELSGGDVTLLRDPDIQEFLACEIYKDLNSKPITEDSLSTFLSGDYSCFTADEQRARFLVRQMFVVAPKRKQLFNAMVDYLGDVTAAQRAGLLGASCVCPTDTWIIDLPLEEYFALTTLGRIAYVSGTPCGGTLFEDAPGGILNGGVWDMTAGSVSGGNSVARKLQIFVPASTTLTRVSVISTQYAAGAGNARSIVTGTSSTASACGSFFAGVAQANADGAWSNELVTIEASSFKAVATPVPAAGITRVILHGTGVPLLAGC